MGGQEGIAACLACLSCLFCPSCPHPAIFAPMKCPSCGSEASGKFCANCGASLVPQRCPQCDAEVRPGTRFCPSCGRSVSGGGRNRALPWIVAGATVATLSAVLLVRLTSQKTAETSAATAEPGTAMPAPDISNMSPRERADRLYNRVMSAAERGDSGEVKFFLPMALQSYALMGPLDPDAHYHLGMIDFVSRDFPAALAQADTIARDAPKHLFASVLRAQVALARGDAAARDRAYRAFLDGYDAEMKAGRTEYDEHRTVLQRMHEEARKALAGK